MAELSRLEAVRKRPGMYVGDPASSQGIETLVFELLANSYDQYLAGRCTKISIEIAADGTMTIEDNGPGIPAHGGDGRPPLSALLTQHSDSPTVDGHRPHVHVGLGGIGLFPVCALSERLEVITVCGGEEARVLCSRGVIVEAVSVAPTSRASGTRVQLRPDPEIFLHARMSRAALAQRLEDLSFLAPGLELRWTIAGDALAARGLAARVALEVPCAIDAVAAHRETTETAAGPIDIEVALGWASHYVEGSEPVIHSFVNLERTIGGGTHEAGLRRGVHEFIGRGIRFDGLGGLRAAVSVLLADVKFGNPMRDRLVTEEVVLPVAAATRKALAAWAEVQPEAAAALRERGRTRRPR